MALLLLQHLNSELPLAFYIRIAQWTFVQPPITALGYMAKSTTSSETHRSFTVRIPISMYLQIGQLAQAEESNINAKVNQLLSLGLGKHITLDAALKRLLTSAMTEETAREPE